MKTEGGKEEQYQVIPQKLVTHPLYPTEGSILFSVQHQGKKDALVPSKPITSAAEQYSNSYT
jgi:hypothetical protein